MNTATKLLRTLGPRYGSGQLLSALLMAWGSKLDAFQADGDAAVSQLSVLTASHEWLDLWGELYAIPRKPGEPDDDYADRLIRRTIMQRPQPMALEDIVNGEFKLSAFFVRDLWPFVLLSDQWTTLPGRPLQVSDGQLLPDFFTFGPNSATVSFSSTYSPGAFGLWIAEQSSQILVSTLDQIITDLPLILLSDQFAPGSPHVSDGQLTTPDFGGPGDTARHSLELPSPEFPISIDDIMSIINQHRAAGTNPVVIATQLRFAA